MDVNGDGKTDLAYIRCQGSRVGNAGCIMEVEAFVSTGVGCRQRRPQRFDSPQDFSDMPNVLVMDVNGDGRDDLVHVGNRVRSGGVGSGLEIHTLLGLDDAAQIGLQSYDVAMFEDTPPVSIGFNTGTDRLSSRSADVNA